MFPFYIPHHIYKKITQNRLFQNFPHISLNFSQNFRRFVNFLKISDSYFLTLFQKVGKSYLESSISNFFGSFLKISAEFWKYTYKFFQDFLMPLPKFIASLLYTYLYLLYVCFHRCLKLNSAAMLNLRYSVIYLHSRRRKRMTGKSQQQRYLVLQLAKKNEASLQNMQRRLAALRTRSLQPLCLRAAYPLHLLRCLLPPLPAQRPMLRKRWMW